MPVARSDSIICRRDGSRSSERRPEIALACCGDGVERFLDFRKSDARPSGGDSIMTSVAASTTKLLEPT